MSCKIESVFKWGYLTGLLIGGISLRILLEVDLIIFGLFLYALGVSCIGYSIFYVSSHCFGQKKAIRNVAAYIIVSIVIPPSFAFTPLLLYADMKRIKMSQKGSK